MIARPQDSGDDRPGALIVAGPTCSGKSALALAIAERVGGVVINADSMQIYRELRIVTARPTAEEEARAPHRAVRRPPGGARRQCGVVARRGAGGDGGGTRGGAIADTVRRHRPLFHDARRRGSSEIPPDPRGRAGRGAADAGGGWAARRCTPLSPRSIRRPPRACAPATASASRGHGKCGAAPDAASRRGKPQQGQPAPWRFSALLLDPAARDVARGDRRAFHRDARARRARRGARVAGARPRSGVAGHARARRAGTGRLICAARSLWLRRRGARNSSPGNTPSGRRRGSAIVRLRRSSTERIRSMRVLRV